MDLSQSTQSDMEFARIPGTTIRASRVALGTWAIGGWMWGGSDESDAIRTIHAALDRGINLIDTAPVYGFGRSEEIVGKALAMDGRRRNALIATKVGLDTSRSEGRIGPNSFRQKRFHKNRLSVCFAAMLSPKGYASGNHNFRISQRLLWCELRGSRDFRA
jgi:aryl-alcohol dehydrogenase-like predicted oxidoreductase